MEEAPTDADLRAENEELRGRVARLERAAQEVQRAHAERLKLATALENIYRGVPDLFFQMRLDGTITHYLASPSTPMYVGPEAFLGRRMQDVLPAEIGAQFEATFAEAAGPAGKARLEYALELDGATEWYEARVIRVGEDGLIKVVRCISEQRRDREAVLRLNVELEERVRQRTAELEVATAEHVALQQQVIEAQRATLLALSTPLVPIAERVVAVPLVGDFDGDRAGRLLEAILEGVQARRAGFVLLDVTGVPQVDEVAARALADVGRAVRLLGAELVLTGIGPEVASALVELGVEFGGVRTLPSLEHGIAYAMQASARPVRR
ncbi:STAS domain-containing protein [Nannocystis bainbridge]|uniref:STAS domain-containing protein n=1 Tax=Nannocystis bainbridge TaxID=2995303 RepID=A0ABT5E5U4_9BACT|nr:STAS domain-containing protein [Nannocystis bainbridge]MDC0721223.1 STAS domain-containing protein [Nannocystis bainbridge]